MTFGKGKIWYDGKFVDWDKATTHVLSHALHYGSSVFEGIRCYNTKKGPAVFRLQDHVNRLYDSAKIYRMKIPYSKEDFCTAILDTIRTNKLKACYIRPLVYRGYGSLGVNPMKNPVNCVIAVWEWGTYLGEGVLEQGVSTRVSSWNRQAPNTFPSLAKAGGNYLNSILIKIEAVEGGYEEGIALDTNGYISEGSGENIFLVKNGLIYTPPSSAAILPGITRHSVFAIARSLDIRIEQHMMPRESLYIMDEVFFSGTAAEITPVSKIDNIIIGSGKRGPVTEKIQKAFFGIIRGETEDNQNWLTYL